jgi:DNA-binding PucR family transcriptional regulator
LEEAAPTRDAEYQLGLREAVACGVDYGIALLEEGLEREPQVPMALVVQSRLAARQRIPVEVVIGRYLAGKKLLAHFILAEAVAASVRDPSALQWALATHEAAFDKLLSSITEEYRREERSRQRSSGDRHLERVRRLLAGEPVDPSCLDYDLSSYHLGVVLDSREARQIIRLLAAKTDCRPLVVRATEMQTWAWLGSKEPVDPADFGRLATRTASASTPIAVGEPAQGCSGWRLTHRQAQAAFLVAKKSESGFARYVDAAMVISASKDPLMIDSLVELYLLPLRRERDGGRALRETLRAYFAAGQNGSSAAAVLGVSRQTVASRLQSVEGRLQQPLAACGDLLHVALQLEELGIADRPYSGHTADPDHRGR